MRMQKEEVRRQKPETRERTPRSAVPAVPRVYELPAGILEKIWLERLRQKQLLRDGKILFTCDSSIVGPDRKLRVLVERIGEVARAVEQMEFTVLRGKLSPHRSAKSTGTRHDLRNELTQLAAAGIAWLESLEAGK